MPTQKQIAANRRNAQKSTGPRTPEGKARSSQNALKSGIDAHAQIIHGESPADLERLKFDYQERFLPDTPEQRMLVDTLIDCEWLLRRFRRVEAELWVDGMRDRVHPTILGESFNRMDETFARLQRRIDAAHRNYRNSLRELERLQAQQAEAALREREPAAEALATLTIHMPRPEIGSVPHADPQPLSAHSNHSAPRPSEAPPAAL
ncbi:MAG TPA: hypothetical protein VHW09_06135 [Bryobacteraceae bacterium]|jgi:hypothetical protein|nr:hypothetical protein [Bryobacteraceae bacterium]